MRSRETEVWLDELEAEASAFEAILEWLSLAIETQQNQPGDRVFLELHDAQPQVLHAFLLHYLDRCRFILDQYDREAEK
jgi:hypothetical protein